MLTSRAKAYKEYRRSRRSLLTRLAPKHSARKVRAQGVQSAYEQARAALARAQSELDETTERGRRLDARLQYLEQQRGRYDAVHAELGRLDARLFDEEAYGIFPVADALAWESGLLRSTRALIPVEVAREKRVRTLLNGATKHLDSCLDQVQTALKACIDLGVSHNVRHKTQVFTGGVFTTVKRVEPRLLAAKNRSGEYHKMVLLARRRQPLVLRPPMLTFLDLTLLPRPISGRGIDEPALYKSLETSYAECRSSQSYVLGEIRTAQAREKALYAHERELGGQIRAADEQLRRARHCLVRELLATHGDVWAVNAALERMFPSEAVGAPPVPGPPAAEPGTTTAAVRPSPAGNGARALPEAAVQTPVRTAAETTQTEDPSEVARPPHSPTSPGIGWPMTESVDRLSMFTERTVAAHGGAASSMRNAALMRLRALVSEINERTRDDSEEEDLPWHNLALGF